MTFLHPWAIWLGVIAAAGPIVVHLLTRPRPARMPLSTLRFVREAVRQRRSRSRLRDFLILTLRTLAILLLAMAMARPQWGTRPLVSDQETGRTVRVVIVDVSQSMAATTGGIEALERARTVAAGLLRYRPGLRANLIFAGSRAEPVFGGPSTNFDALRDELARCEPTCERLDVNRALAKAAEMLAPSSDEDDRRRELVIVSDFQRTNWVRADFSPVPESTHIQFESTAADQPPPNLAILRAAGRPISAQGQSARLEIEIGNFSPASRKVVVEATIGQSTWRLEGTCPAGRTTTLTEEIQLRGLGWQTGRAALVDVDDALAADNTCPLVVRLRPKPTYAILTRQPADRLPSSSHFLEWVLRPESRADDDASAEVVRIDPSRWDAAAVSAADLIFLDHPGKLEDESIRLLAALLRRGRGLFYVAAQRIDATNLKRLVTAAGGSLRMPVEFTPMRAGVARRDLPLGSVAENLPPFNVFGDNLSSVVGSLRFGGGLGTRRLPDGLDEEVLATYVDGSACMVLTRSDAGTLAVLNAELTDSNLPKTSAFLPLMDEFVRQMLTANGTERTADCGEPLVVHLPSEAGAAAGLELIGPQTDDELHWPLGQLTDEETGVTWHCERPTLPGVYQVCRDETTVYSLALRVPEEESRLDALSADVLTGRLAAERNTYFRGATGRSERRDDSWIAFAVGCVICMLGELAALLALRT